MKQTILTTLFCLSTILCVQGQNKEEIKQAIDKLISNPENQEAYTALYQANKESNALLKDFQSDLEKVVENGFKGEDFNFDLANLALELCMSKSIQLPKIAEEDLTGILQKIRPTLKQDINYHSWIWDDEEYMYTRGNAGLILDLLGYGRSDASKAELETSIAYYKDNRLKFFALVSLDRRGHNVNTEHFEHVASDDEARGLLFAYLEENQKVDLFPRTYKNQEALSKANMVNWLIYPTELARTPSDIQLLEAITVEYDDVGPADFYLWKFKSDDDEYWKEKGWMVGLSGPFLRSEAPSMNAYGFTFSAFAQLKDHSNEEHFQKIIDILTQAQEGEKN